MERLLTWEKMSSSWKAEREKLKRGIWEEREMERGSVREREKGEGALDG